MIAPMTALLGWLKDNKDALGGLQSLVTVIATLVGAVWAWNRFGWTREGYARANVDAKVVCKRLGPAATLVVVSVTIENKGTRRVLVRDGWVELLQVLPIAPALIAPGAIDPKRRRIGWPSLGEYRFRSGTGGPERTQADIDPGETAVMAFEFVVPGAASVIKAWGHIKDPQTGLGYSFETLADVDAPASQPTSAAAGTVSGATSAAAAPPASAPAAPATP